MTPEDKSAHQFRLSDTESIGIAIPMLSPVLGRPVAT